MGLVAIERIFAFIFGNAFWDWLVTEFDLTPERIITFVVLIGAVIIFTKHFRKKVEPVKSIDVHAVKKAESLIEFGDCEKAIEICNQLLAGNSHDAGLYNTRGNAYFCLKDYRQAVADYTKALKLNPRFYLAWHNRGMAYEQLNDKSRAVVDYSKAISLNPNYAEAYYNRGLCYESLGDKTGARADFAKAKQLGYSEPEI